MSTPSESPFSVTASVKYAPPSPRCFQKIAQRRGVYGDRPPLRAGVTSVATNSRFQSAVDLRRPVRLVDGRRHRARRPRFSDAVVAARGRRRHRRDRRPGRRQQQQHQHQHQRLWRLRRWPSPSDDIAWLTVAIPPSARPTALYRTWRIFINFFLCFFYRCCYFINVDVDEKAVLP